MPPWATDGTLSPFALEAADLNASRVFEPLRLVRGLVIASNALRPLVYLRRVNHTNHASLTMSNLAAVEPDRICIINGQAPDGLNRQDLYNPETMFMNLPIHHEHLP
jgi:hypothetical protein